VGHAPPGRLGRPVVVEARRLSLAFQHVGTVFQYQFTIREVLDRGHFLLVRQASGHGHHDAFGKRSIHRRGSDEIEHLLARRARHACFVTVSTNIVVNSLAWRGTVFTRIGNNFRQRHRRPGEPSNTECSQNPFGRPSHFFASHVPLKFTISCHLLFCDRLIVRCARSPVADSLPRFNGGAWSHATKSRGGPSMQWMHLSQPRQRYMH